MSDIVTVRLTKEEAELVAQNIDGWLDAGAGKEGLEEGERLALRKAYAQLTRHILRDQRASAKAAS